MPDCEKVVVGGGLCQTHYMRKRRHGSPFIVLPRHRPKPPATQESLKARWESRVLMAGPDDCWPWQGRISTRGMGAGYGELDNMFGTRLAHRIGYALLVGPIPDNVPLDHLCHNRDTGCPGGGNCLHRRCVNPAHLEPVSLSVNAKRGESRKREAQKAVALFRQALNMPHASVEELLERIRQLTAIAVKGSFPSPL